MIGLLIIRGEYVPDVQIHPVWEFQVEPLVLLPGIGIEGPVLPVDPGRTANFFTCSLKGETALHATLGKWVVISIALGTLIEQSISPGDKRGFLRDCAQLQSILSTACPQLIFEGDKCSIGLLLMIPVLLYVIE